MKAAAMKNSVLLSTLLLVNVNVAMAGAKDKAAQKNQQTAFIETVRDSLFECKRSNEVDLMTTAVHGRAATVHREYLSSVERMKQLSPGSTSPEVKPLSEGSELLYPSCAKRKKSEVIAQSKEFIKSFRAPNSQGQAKALVAQWLTAMDTIGKEINEAETAKFETLANAIILEIQ